MALSNAMVAEVLFELLESDLPDLKARMRQQVGGIASVELYRGERALRLEIETRAAAPYPSGKAEFDLIIARRKSIDSSTASKTELISSTNRVNDENVATMLFDFLNCHRAILEDMIFEQYKEDLSVVWIKNQKFLTLNIQKLGQDEGPTSDNDYMLTINDADAQ